YDWPGNVRELQNTIERAVALSARDQLAVDDLPDPIRTFDRHEIAVPDDVSRLLPVHELERRYTLHVLRSVGGNKSRAARILGYDRRTLYRKLGRIERAAARAARREANAPH